MDRMIEDAKKVVKEKVPVLIAGGGDGTFNVLSDILVGSETALGILPLGTGNAFARDLGIAPDLQQAIDVIATGKIVPVDIGVVNGRHFLNVATVGLTVAIAASLQESLKRKYGRVVYLYAVARAYRHIKPFEATLKTENGEITFPTLQVVIGNGRYHAGPFKLAPDAGITTGHLSLYALESSNKAALIKLGLHLTKGDQGALPEVHSEQTLGGTLTCKPIKNSILDGERGPQTPLKFETKHDALKVIVPAEFGG